MSACDSPFQCAILQNCQCSIVPAHLWRSRKGDCRRCSKLHGASNAQLTISNDCHSLAKTQHIRERPGNVDTVVNLQSSASCDIQKTTHAESCCAIIRH